MKLELTSAVRAWVTAKTVQGQWSRIVHVARDNGAHTPASCVCGLKLSKRVIQTHQRAEEVPKDRKVCARCFDRLEGEWWQRVATLNPSILPRGKKRLENLFR